MTTFAKKGAVIASLVLLMLAPAGCQTTKKVMGTDEQTMAGAPDRVVEAAKAALADLKFDQISGNATKLDGEVRAKSAQGKDVVIKVHSTGENVSTMSVRVGTMGDWDMNKSIIEATQRRLR